jgi:hypothetical protein
MPVSVPIRIAATFTADPLIAPLRHVFDSKGGIEVVDVDGHHGAVTVDPHAAVLAKKLMPYLEAVQREHARSSAAIAQVADTGD